MTRLEKGSVVQSPLTERRYRIGRVIGTGGYGKAFAATDLQRKREVCLKYTLDQRSWQREAYFGELLEGNRRAIQIYDSFPLRPARGPIRYCHVLELAEGGTLADYFARGEKPFSEAHARREILGLLKLLDLLHRGNATHRDITPLNVFVCGKGILKLGDFGIARHELPGVPREPDSFNEEFVTLGVADAEHRTWTRADDVFQVGQLLAMLLLGKTRKIEPAQLRRAKLSPKLERVIRRAIGARSRRFRDAGEMRKALARSPSR